MNYFSHLTSRITAGTSQRAERERHGSTHRRRVTSLAMAVGLFAGGIVGVADGPTLVAAPPVGQGFTVTPADLAFILQQIKIAERHSRSVAGTEPTQGPNLDVAHDPQYCRSLVGTEIDQIPSALLSFGLRTVSGDCNNLQVGQETFGAADQTFPRLTTPQFDDAEAVAFDLDGPGPMQVGDPTSYASTSGAVFDNEPRTISNLIVDQTFNNPAAVAAAGQAVRAQSNDGASVPCNWTPGHTPPASFVENSSGCVADNETLFIENVTTDVGLSPPFNSLFTIFGQFFDHGLDKITNGGNGVVFVPLNDDDPLVAGPNHIFGDGDDLDLNLRFMALTRGTIVPGTDGVRNAPNTDTPFVDQSQTYTSHASHQVFLREYVNNSLGQPVATGKFLSTSDGHGLATWAQIKEQAATLLGLQLVDTDVGNIPMIATDPYGKFIPGPNGLPQYVTDVGLVEGQLAGPGPDTIPGTADDTAPVPADSLTHTARRIDTAFLNDIAHSAAPKTLPDGTLFPDDDLTPGGSLDTPFPAGSYDDELLGIHAICGDGRCNENIALQAIHQVFHNEHDRLVDEIETTLTNDTSGITNLADWQSADGADGWNGERLFQAARFITEMEYQHLVFEEFARKVQPLINPFEAFAFNQTDVDPAITAEFAHAVYRFGHSMLVEDIPRVNADGSRNDIPLLDGFLNPAEYYDGGTLTSKEALTSIIMGLSDQAGNEIDEFVSDTLRNNLLGLPLDLPTINMVRARSEGVPPLNVVRRQIHAVTNDAQLMPYTNWIDFGEHLRHPESLVNFIAAYGTHPSIRTLDPDGVGPLTAGSNRTRRLAADQILNGTTLPGPDTIFGTDCAGLTPSAECADDIFAPTDSSDFVFSDGAYANAGTASQTGLDDIDLWVGGLAENTNLFGGLLGSTFNYVFENQMTNLQNGDRFYYLARTPGMNLRASLEGNSFSEMIMRNSDATTLKADPMSTADCKFEIGLLTWPAASGSYITGPGSVNDVVASECDENRLLIRQPNGQIKYRAVNSVDPSGINGQSVFNGTNATDRIYGGNDNDTVWGGEGNDIIDGGGGDDVVLGGEGNDIITDFAGNDVPKGGPGNDAIDGGPGDDIIMGADGKDFTNGGANVNEHFLGEGNDFAIGGQGADVVFGDGGDDWAEGGDQPDLLIGDSSTLFFDDHNLPGHDVLIGQGGDDDYDMEGGDDIGVAGPGVEKNAGASGYDWITGIGDPQPQNADLNLLIINAPAANETRDRYNEVEALSGGNLNDILRGDDVIPSAIGGIGFIGCDALDQDGLDRISGLDFIVPPLTTPVAGVIANAQTNYCGLTGNVWGDGNILLGGAGSDVLEGRGADDIIDGDRYLNVRLSVRTNADGTGLELGTTNLMENAATSGNFGANTGGMTLQQAVFAGKVDPGQIVIVREIVSNPSATDVDTARFAGNRSEYVINTAFRLDPVDPRVIVNHVAPVVPVAPLVGDAVCQGGCGIDTVRNIEKLEFKDQTISFGTPVASVSPTSLAFGQRSTVAAPVTLPVTLTNTGNGDLNVTSRFMTGPDAAEFSVTGVCLTVVPGGTCVFNVSFDPATAALKTADLNITHDAAGSPTIVPLTGEGVSNTPAVGLPTISDVTPTEGSIVNATTASITDANGLVGATFSFQWQRSLANGSFTGLAANNVGTGPSFTPTQAQVGRRLRVVVTFVDNLGSLETAISATTNVVGDFFPGPGENNTGVDVRTFTAGDDIVAGGLGDDTLNTAGGADIIRFSGLNEGFDNITGGGGVDAIQAMAASTTIGLQALATVESITSSGWADVHIQGSSGVNTLNFNAVTLTGIVDIDGGAGSDTITGSAAADVILGGADNDTLNGGGGNDILEGGLGVNVLNGNAGLDQFRYRAGGVGTDVIVAMDVNPTGGQDLIDLRLLGITAVMFNSGSVTLAASGVATIVTITIGGVIQGTIQINGFAPGAGANRVSITDFILSP